MGDVINLAQRREARRRAAGARVPRRAQFFFDLSSPFTYLMRHMAGERAAMLRLPLSWPDSFPAEAPAAMRVAAFAAEVGRGAGFVLAAARLAFCGGFDLEDPEILAEAAAAAGIVLEDCLRAARDAGRDGPVEAAGRRLLAAGADRLPALRVGRALYWGEDRLSEAALAARLAAAAQA
jgi:2-hydroxychromene-2-carboxylate isomerase